MISFEISINGQKRCTTGVRDIGVASVLATWARRVARDPASGEPVADRFEEELTLEVAGLEHDPDGAAVHVTWIQQPLTLGQQVSFTIVDSDEVDPPPTRHREDPTWTEQRKRAYYERLKHEYGDA